MESYLLYEAQRNCEARQPIPGEMGKRNLLYLRSGRPQGTQIGSRVCVCVCVCVCVSFSLFFFFS